MGQVATNYVTNVAMPTTLGSMHTLGAHTSGVSMISFASQMIMAYRGSPLGRSNMALHLAPFGRWTLRDKAAQRRLALR